MEKMKMYRGIPFLMFAAEYVKWLDIIFDAEDISKIFSFPKEDMPFVMEQIIAMGRALPKSLLKKCGIWERGMEGR